MKQEHAKLGITFPNFLMSPSIQPTRYPRFRCNLIMSDVAPATRRSAFVSKEQIGQTFDVTKNDIGSTGTTMLTNTRYLVMSITVQIAVGTPAGTYQIMTTGFNSNTDHSKTTEANDGNFVHHFIAPTVYSITVVPEPATLS